MGVRWRSWIVPCAKGASMEAAETDLYEACEMSADQMHHSKVPLEPDACVTQEQHSPPREPQATIAFGDLESAEVPSEDVTQDFESAPRLDMFPVHQGESDGRHVGMCSSAGYRFRVLR